MESKYWLWCYIVKKSTNLGFQFFIIFSHFFLLVPKWIITWVAKLCSTCTIISWPIIKYVCFIILSSDVFWARYFIMTSDCLYIDILWNRRLHSELGMYQTIEWNVHIRQCFKTHFTHWPLLLDIVQKLGSLLSL